MIIETGSLNDFKRCVLDQVWLWEFGCGHVLISDADYAEEYGQFAKHVILCPYCREADRRPVNFMNVMWLRDGIV